jgi:hypothetical protein
VTYLGPSGATMDVVFDVTGYYTNNLSGGTYHPLTPARLVDSRTGVGLSTHLTANVPATFQVTGRGGVPSNATSVTGNVTAVNETAGWALYVGPTPTSNPPASTINFTTGQVIANGLTVQLGSGGTLSVTYMGPSGATTDIVFDVTGYYTANLTGTQFHPLNPTRLADSRIGQGLATHLTANQATSFPVRATTTSGIPSNATAVTGNVTVVNETAGWALYLGPTLMSNPTTSTVNFTTGQVIANGVTVQLSSGGALCVTYMGPAGATADVVFDVTGYYS